MYKSKKFVPLYYKIIYLKKLAQYIPVKNNPQSPSLIQSLSRQGNQLFYFKLVMIRQWLLNQKWLFTVSKAALNRKCYWRYRGVCVGGGSLFKCIYWACFFLQWWIIQNTCYWTVLKLEYLLKYCSFLPTSPSNWSVFATSHPGIQNYCSCGS